MEITLKKLKEVLLSMGNDEALAQKISDYEDSEKIATLVAEEILARLEKMED